MSYSQVGTLRLTELRYQVGKGRVGGPSYPSSFIWTHKLFSAFFKKIFMILCMCGKLKDRLKHVTTWRWYLSSWFIIFLDLSLLQFFPIGRPPLWDGLLTRISLSSLRTSLLSGGKWVFCFSDLCMSYCSCFMSVFRRTICPEEVISHQLSGRPTSFHELAV